MPAPVPPKPAVVKPVFGKPLAQPLKPVAGKQFRLTVAVKRSDTGAPLTAGRLVVGSTVAGKKVKNIASFKAGKAKVAVLLPKKAKGKLLRLTLRVTASGKTAARSSFTYTVR